MKTLSTQELIKVVRIHGAANYNKHGWDILTECWDDAEFAEVIGSAKTAAEAISRCAMVAKLMAGARNEARWA